MKKRKLLSLLLASAMIGQTMFSGGAGTVHAVDAVDPALVTDESLTANGTAEPKKDTVVPDGNQYKYQKDELAGFCHFGMNTFTGSEWGNGKENPSQFTLTNAFDAESLVKGFADAGFKKLIVTAKHHDGFCIWRSKHTNHDLESTNYPGDVLAEISAACSKYGLDMGLYLSPWDVNNESYGYRDQYGNPCDKKDDVLDYNDYYNDQLVEILGDPKYGRDGHFVEVWMDGAKGEGQFAQDYDFVRWFNTIQQYEGKAAGFKDDCMLFGAEAYTTVRWIGNENGFAADETWSKSKTDKKNNTIDSNFPKGSSYTKGYVDGNQWTVPEADARITNGWFWWSNRNTPKDIKQLGDMYFNSVGHNATLLFNVPPNNQGKVDTQILSRLSEFGSAIKTTFKTNLAEDAAIAASEVRGNDRAYSPKNVLDGKDDTYWTVNDNTNTGTLVVDLGQTKQFDVVSIEEAIQFGQRIGEFKVEYKKGNDAWKVFDEGATIGAKRLCRKSAVSADKIRITVKTAAGAENPEPIISEVGVYKAAPDFSAPKGFPDELEVIDDRKFEKKGGWTDEPGEQYLENTDTWANPGNGTEATVTFKGTKAWLVGTVDSGHGTADIYIDGNFVKTIDANGSARKVQSVLFETDDLTNGTHTMRIVPKNKATGLDALLVLNNDGKGMFDFEQKSYRVDEGAVTEIKVKRIGGAEGEADVDFEVNPGSAWQKHFNANGNMKLHFNDGQKEAMAKVETYLVPDVEPDLSFSIELVNPTNGTIAGFNTPANVVITDYESISHDDKYTADNPFKFPSKVGETKKMEAEFATEIINNDESDSDPDWDLSIAEAAWASNGKYVNCLAYKDYIKYAYTAKAGTYKVVMTYRSGSNANKIAWSEQNQNITADNVSAGSTNSSETKTVEFNLVVTKPGAGVLAFTAPDTGKGPQIDKFDITAVELEPEEFVHYTEEVPFVFPIDSAVRVLEAEHTILYNDPQGDNGWPVAIVNDSWASNGQYVDAMGVKDTLTLHYTAAEPGEYTALVTYQSGNPKNGISWRENSGKIEAGSETIGASDAAEGVVHTQEITLKVKEAGAGVLVIESGADKGPRLDKLEIARKVAAEDEYVVTVGDKEVARGPYNTKVVMPAPTVPEGKKFAGWREVGTETILSTQAEYKFYIARSITLEPVFADKEEEVPMQAVLSSVAVTKNANTKSDVKFVGQLVLPEGCKIVEAGLIWSTKPAGDVSLIVDGQLNTNLKPTKISAISDTNQFSVTIKGLPSTMFIRGRIFATIEKDGVRTLIYSDEELALAAK